MNDVKGSTFNIEIKTDDGVILYNTFSGAFIKLDDVLERYKEKLTEAETETLINQGVLVRKQICEENDLIVRRYSAIYNPNPHTLYFAIAPTLQCMAKCPYCFEADLKEKPAMSEKTAFETVAYIKQMLHRSEAKELRLNFFGGEPLLKKNILLIIGSELKKHCESTGVSINSRLVTNGILLDKETVKQLKENAGLKYIQVTLDGTEKEYNKIKGLPVFDKVIDNIETASELVRIIVRLNVSNKNKDDLMALMHYLMDERNLKNRIEVYPAQIKAELGAKVKETELCTDEQFVDFKKQFVNEFISGINNKSFLPTVRRKACAYESINNGCIGPKGEIYQCEKLFGRPEYVIGNVPGGKERTEYELSFFKELNKECLEKKCPLLPICYSGCPFDRQFSDNPVDCESFRKSVEEAMNITYSGMKK